MSFDIKAIVPIPSATPASTELTPNYVLVSTGEKAKSLRDHVRRISLLTSQFLEDFEDDEDENDYFEKKKIMWKRI